MTRPRPCVGDQIETVEHTPACSAIWMATGGCTCAEQDAAQPRTPEPAPATVEEFVRSTAVAVGLDADDAAEHWRRAVEPTESAPADAITRLPDAWQDEADQHTRDGKFGIAEGLRTAAAQLTEVIRAAATPDPAPATVEDMAEQLVVHQPVYSDERCRYICRCGDEHHWPTHAAEVLATPRTPVTAEQIEAAADVLPGVDPGDRPYRVATARAMFRAAGVPVEGGQGDD